MFNCNNSVLFKMSDSSKAYAFSNDGGTAIERHVDVEPILLQDVDLETFFELERCTEWIRTNDFKKVCLQFPDELLVHSFPVAKILEQRLGQRIHILADTTYGSCCVDEKTVKHIQGDCVIHFGLSCLSATQRIPVLYIFTQPKVNEEEPIRIFQNTFQPEDEVVILYDVIYESLAHRIFNGIASTHPASIISELIIPGTLITEDDQLVIHGRRIPTTRKAEEIKKVFYIGSQERTLLNFIFRLPEAQFLILNPKTMKVEDRKSNLMKLLMRRNYYMERLKDAATVGILVGTLAVENYLNIIGQIKEALTRAGKKFYIVSIGEITPPKLANFPDIEVFVLVSCPESVILESKEFFQPIVTPYELELALNKARNWTGEYLLDFRLLLPGGQSHMKLESGESSDVSLITGGVRVMTNWKGLDDAEKGQDAVFEGRSGIAHHYHDEPIGDAGDESSTKELE